MQGTRSYLNWLFIEELQRGLREFKSENVSHLSLDFWKWDPSLFSVALHSSTASVLVDILLTRFHFHLYFLIDSWFLIPTDWNSVWLQLMLLLFLSLFYSRPLVLYGQIAPPVQSGLLIFKLHSNCLSWDFHCCKETQWPRQLL